MMRCAPALNAPGDFRHLHHVIADEGIHAIAS
jgi:hypothetical protein